MKCENNEHVWDGCVCTRCGETRDKEHTFVVIRSFSEAIPYGPGNSSDLIVEERECTKCGQKSTVSHVEQ